MTKHEAVKLLGRHYMYATRADKLGSVELFSAQVTAQGVLVSGGRVLPFGRAPKPLTDEQIAAHTLQNHFAAAMRRMMRDPGTKGLPRDVMERMARAAAERRCAR